jgi:hypothetical protein
VSATVPEYNEMQPPSSRTGRFPGDSLTEGHRENLVAWRSKRAPAYSQPHLSDVSRGIAGPVREGVWVVRICHVPAEVSELLVDTLQSHFEVVICMCVCVWRRKRRVS